MNFPAALQRFQICTEQIELFVPDGKAVQDAYQDGKILFPYWSKVWASALSLGEFLLLHSYYVQNKKIVELGAGLGLPALVAARYASGVLCTDHAAEAVELARLSAAHNRLTNFHSALLDWNHLPPELEAEVILLSDINYEPDAFNGLMKMVRHFLEQNATILLSTPQRLMAKAFIAPLLHFCTQQQEVTVMQEGNEIRSTILVLQNK